MADWSDQASDPIGDLRDYMKLVEEAPPRLCGLTEPHVVSRRASGWTTCAMCFTAVYVEPGSIPS